MEPTGKLRLAQAALLPDEPDFSRERHALELLLIERWVVWVAQRTSLHFGVAHVFESCTFLVGEAGCSATLLIVYGPFRGDHPRNRYRT